MPITQRARGRWRDALWWAALAAGPLFWLALFLLERPPFQPEWILRTPLVYLWPVLFMPVLEEWIFRGWLQPALAARWPRRYGPLSLANLLASVAFTALHFFQHAPLWAASVFLPSLLFGYFRERHDGLASPVILHIWYNAGYFLIFAAP